MVKRWLIAATLIIPMSAWAATSNPQSVGGIDSGPSTSSSSILQPAGQSPQNTSSISVGSSGQSLQGSGSADQSTKQLIESDAASAPQTLPKQSGSIPGIYFWVLVAVFIAILVSIRPARRSEPIV